MSENFILLKAKHNPPFFSFVWIAPKRKGAPSSWKETQVNNDYLKHLQKQRNKVILMALKNNSHEWAYCTGGAETLFSLSLYVITVEQRADWRAGRAVFKMVLVFPSHYLPAHLLRAWLIACPKVTSSSWVSELRSQALVGTALDIVVSNQRKILLSSQKLNTQKAARTCCEYQLILEISITCIA